jgi:hypothetical protein
MDGAARIQCVHSPHMVLHRTPLDRMMYWTLANGKSWGWIFMYYGNVSTKMVHRAYLETWFMTVDQVVIKR